MKRSSLISAAALAIISAGLLTSCDAFLSTGLDFVDGTVIPSVSYSTGLTLPGPTFSWNYGLPFGPPPPPAPQPRPPQRPLPPQQSRPPQQLTPTPDAPPLRPIPPLSSPSGSNSGSGLRPGAQGRH